MMQRPTSVTTLARVVAILALASASAMADTPRARIEFSLFDKQIGTDRLGAGVHGVLGLSSSGSGSGAALSAWGDLLYKGSAWRLAYGGLSYDTQSGKYTIDAEVLGLSYLASKPAAFTWTKSKTQLLDTFNTTIYGVPVTAYAQFTVSATIGFKNISATTDTLFGARAFVEPGVAFQAGGGIGYTSAYARLSVGLEGEIKVSANVGADVFLAPTFAVVGVDCVLQLKGTLYLAAYGEVYLGISSWGTWLSGSKKFELMSTNLGDPKTFTLLPYTVFSWK